MTSKRSRLRRVPRLDRELGAGNNQPDIIKMIQHLKCTAQNMDRWEERGKSGRVPDMCR
jgi:hypothetical protein